ncbi:MAG: porin family protein [Planctomycetota bacterium]
MKCMKVWMFLLISLLLINSPAYSQDPLAEEENGWKVSAAPYFWAPSIDGDSTISGATAAIDLSFSDIMDDFDVWGISNRVEAWKGDWGLIFDGMYVDMETEGELTDPPPAGEVDVDIESGTADFALAYKLVDLPLEEGTSRKLMFSPLGGLRYQYFKQEITLKADHPLGPAGTTLGTSKDWVEPFVGAQFRYDLTEKLAVISRADIGGFGIGSASDLTWNFVIGMDWTFKDNMDLKFGYRVMDMDYSNGSGLDEFGFNGKLSGPIIGLNIHF